MPDIGSTLREARTRQRIDIAEIEADTKIRAKYLRALENEEWDLLPGPTYVKSFLRTYADALGLDGRLLIEEYKLRHERLSDVELQPIAPPGRRERQRRPGPIIPRGVVILVVIAGLIAALYALGRGTGNDKAPAPASTVATATRPATPSSGKKRAGAATSSTRGKRKHTARRARVTVVATGQVYVCLKAAGGRTPVNGVILTSGGRKGPYRSAHLRLLLGNGEARLSINGRQRTVPPVANGVGYDITATRVRTLPRSAWPKCSGA